MIPQTTIASAVSASGIGLHTAVPVNLRLLPAPPDTGYVFIRTDLGGFELPASVEFIAHCSYATTLMKSGVMLSTIEHLLAALRGVGVDNCYIEIDNLELPIMDGSSEDFVALLERAGIESQEAARRALMICEKVEVYVDGRYMSVEPAPGYYIDCQIDFQHPLIGLQCFSLELADDTFGREIAAARTFGFTGEIEALRRANLILGGSLDNAIVLTDEGMLNPTSLRFPDEFVRHKILDIIGDMALLGMPLLGRIQARKSGHAVHAALMTKLLRQRSSWEIVELKDQRALTAA